MLFGVMMILMTIKEQTGPKEIRAMEKPYTTFLAELKAAKGKGKVVLLRRAFDGDFGPQVKHTIFGIGDFDTACLPEARGNLNFMASLEG